MRYGVGIDVSKEKSTITIINGEKAVVAKMKEVGHNKESLGILVKELEKLGKENVRIVMEETGNYHLPMYVYLLGEGYYVVSENAFKIKKYLDREIRPGKTDKKDSEKLARYVIDNWNELRKKVVEDKIYKELRFLSRQYESHIEIRSQLKINLSNLCDQAFVGYYKLLTRDNFEMGIKIIEKYYHPSIVREKSFESFFADVLELTKGLGKYNMTLTLTTQIYKLAQTCIEILPKSDILKVCMEQACKALKSSIQTSNIIISQMIEIARELKEYEELKSISGVGEILAARFIAEVGDINKFKNAGSLIAYAGIDSPPYQSGKMDINGRKISKRGNKYLRRVGYEIMFSIKRSGRRDSEMYLYMQCKENEGKAKKSAKIAGLNKFLRKYYGIMKSIYGTNVNNKIA